MLELTIIAYVATFVGLFVISWLTFLEGKIIQSVLWCTGSFFMLWIALNYINFYY